MSNDESKTGWEASDYEIPSDPEEKAMDHNNKIIWSGTENSKEIAETMLLNDCWVEGYESKTLEQFEIGDIFAEETIQKTIRVSEKFSEDYSSLQSAANIGITGKYKLSKPGKCLQDLILKDFWSRKRNYPKRLKEAEVAYELVRRLESFCALNKWEVNLDVTSYMGGTHRKIYSAFPSPKKYRGRFVVRYNSNKNMNVSKIEWMSEIESLPEEGEGYPRPSPIKEVD